METATLNLLGQMAKVFLSRHRLQSFEAERADLEDWRRHFREIVRDLLEAGVDLPPGTGKAEERYIELRQQWHHYIAAFSASLGYDLNEIVAS